MNQSAVEECKNTKLDADQKEIMSLCRRRGILYPSYEIYGGVAGFFDWGPLGTRLKENFIKLWREVYIEGEEFYEIDCPNISPESVFQASGHLDEFTDFMTKCSKCGQFFRADHLAEEHHKNPDALDAAELKSVLDDNNIRCPLCKGELGDLYPFNLMFRTNIGPTSDRIGYLRPETAQGMFLNFKNLLFHHRTDLPFGAVQIGKGFRNEISPRQGVIRVREFNMAEVEYFIDPENTSHDRFSEVKDTVVTLLQDTPEKRTIQITLGEAMENNIITNQILAYFIAKTQSILVRGGIRPEFLRFRQHEEHEMAHYAEDCWDAESLTSFGWIEIVGIADRSCYDLERHMEFSKEDLRAQRKLEQTVKKREKYMEPNMSVLGPLFKGEAGKISNELSQLEPHEIENLDIDRGFELEVDGSTFNIEPKMFNFIEREVEVSVEKFIPRVVEPSYGVDRILYCIMEHSMEKRIDDGPEEFRIMHFPPLIAPYQYAVFPLMKKEGLTKESKGILEEIKRRTIGRGYIPFYDVSGSIGRRYSRMDEVGTPLCFTIDYRTLEDGTFTLRERDSRSQIRITLESDIEGIFEMLVENGGSLEELAESQGYEII